MSIEAFELFRTSGRPLLGGEGGFSISDSLLLTFDTFCVSWNELDQASGEAARQQLSSQKNGAWSASVSFVRGVGCTGPAGFFSFSYLHVHSSEARLLPASFLLTTPTLEKAVVFVQRLFLFEGMDRAELHCWQTKHELRRRAGVSLLNWRPIEGRRGPTCVCEEQVPSVTKKTKDLLRHVAARVLSL